MARLFHDSFFSIRFITLVVVFLLGGCQPSSTEIAVGQRFPKVFLEGLDGKVEALSQYHGKVVVLNFWATWCEPCRREMPALQRLSERVDPDKIVVLGVSVDEDVNLVREFNLKYGTKFAGYIDRDRKVSEGQLGLSAYPQTFVISPDGFVALLQQGEYRWASTDVFDQLQLLVMNNGDK
ncbi:MAG: TlpA disulfide reductase family protein [Porticoccus sp.]